MDGTIADSLQSWASQATPDELRVGPHAERLGGRVGVAAVAEELAAGALFPYLSISPETTTSQPPTRHSI